MELEGTLKATSLPELLQFLSSEKKTGVLTIKSGEKQISLMIQEGKIVNSSSIDRPRKLGEMLVNRGFIRRSDLEEVLAQQKSIAAEKLVGELLIENNLVSAEVLKEAIRLQLEEELWELFGWKEGTFQFRYEKDKYFSNILVELDIEPFLLEGSRRLDEWKTIAKNIDNENLVVEINPITGEEFDREIALSESEWQILALINGFYNVGSIVSRSSLGRFETFRVLSSFLVAGLIRIKEGDATLQKPELEEERLREAIAKEPLPLATEKKGFGKLFPFLRAPAVEETAAELLNFTSPIGAICHVINRLFQQLATTQNFLASSSDKNLVNLLWQEVLMNYPKADLVSASDNRLDSYNLEFFADSVGINSDTIFNCYEETLTALKDLCSKLWRIIALRLGEKNSRRIITTLIEDIEGKINIKQGEDFKLKDFFQKLWS